MSRKSSYEHIGGYSRNEMKAFDLPMTTRWRRQRRRFIRLQLRYLNRDMKGDFSHLKEETRRFIRKFSAQARNG